METRSSLPMREVVAQGLAAGEFSIAYQPQLSADGARVVGVEALARWRTRERGWISPAEFIPKMEAEGGIGELTDFVLRQACGDAMGWPGLSISVNVSAVQLRDPRFAEYVESVLSSSGLEPRRLELEVVESALIENFDAALAIAQRLRILGVRFALDDFGTGYSSLTYLKKLPIDCLKIDRSFVEDIGYVQSASIVHAVVALARALGLKVVAEGVETAEQHRFLRACGCHFLQGYLFAKPMSAPAISDYIGVERKRMALSR
jgi:diguanylate cyclase